MNYSELLKDPKWNVRCNDILKRDNYRCQKCGKFGLHYSSSYAFDKEGEFNSFTNGILIDGLSIVDYVNRLFRSEKVFSKMKAIVLKENYNFQTGGYCNSISIEPFDDDVQGTCSIGELGIIIPQSDMPLQDQLVYAKMINDTEISLPSIKHPHLHKGGLFIFNNALTSQYVLRICPLPMGQFEYQNKIIFGDCFILNFNCGNCCLCLYISNYDFGEKITLIPRLNVHHKYYIQGNAPWEYDDDALITLCEECHHNIHSTSQVPVYRTLNGARLLIGNAPQCLKCGGSGYLPEYKHRDNGICYRCMGEGIELSHIEQEN